jgi:HD-GYP domain-containing protein (c-di-GMP phosphodiesterase class II)
VAKALAGTGRNRFRLDRGQVLAVSLLVGVPAGLFLALRSIPGLDLLFQSVVFHVIVVSSIAACALIVAMLAAVAAGRTGRSTLVMLAMGCVSVGFFMLAHGLTTPGIWHREFNMWVVRYPTLALTAFAVFMCAAVARSDGPVTKLIERHAMAVTLTFAGLLAVAVIPTVLWPNAGIWSTPIPGEDIYAKAAGVAGAIALVVAGEIHRRRWLLSRDKVELALLVACWLAAESIASMLLGVLWRLSWWDYHVLLLIGFSAAVYAIVAGYRRSRTVEGALTGVALRSTLDQIEHGSPDALRSLVTAVEAKDSYTRGHSTRVAELSVGIGEHIDVRSKALRSLAQGSLLHDIGKIGVPDGILNKPGMLTPEERLVIEEHPAVGWNIVRQAPSLRGAWAVVRHHHERFDGNGYPDGLARDDIPLAARITAVADVWDALTSDRAYRPAWPIERALEIMLEGRGTHFDPDALDALLQLLDAEGIRPITYVRPKTSLAAVEACHEQPERRPARVPASARQPRA